MEYKKINKSFRQSTKSTIQIQGKKIGLKLIMLHVERIIAIAKSNLTLKC